jgi:uncharacterized protein (TIGR02246 family)
MLRSMVIVGLIVGVGCSRDGAHAATGNAARSDDVEAIRQTYTAFVAANLAGDVEKELSTLTDDAVFMPPGVPDVVGKDALRKRWTPREASDTLEVFDFDPGEIIVAGDLAYSRGKSMARSRNRRTGQVTIEVVRHLDILRRQQDGRWLIARHIRNTAAPPA